MSSNVIGSISNVIGGAIDKYGGDSKDDILSKWIEEGKKVGGESKLLFDLLDKVGQIPNGIDILLKIHGIKPLAKFLLLRLQLFSRSRAANKEDQLKREKAESDLEAKRLDQIKKELEALATHESLLKSEDSVAIRSSYMDTFSELVFELDSTNTNRSKDLDLLQDLLVYDDIYVWSGIDIQSDSEPNYQELLKQRQLLNQLFIPTAATSVEEYMKYLNLVERRLNKVDNKDILDQLTPQQKKAFQDLGGTNQDLRLRIRDEILFIRTRIKEGDSLNDIFEYMEDSFEFIRIMLTLDSKERSTLISKYKEVWYLSKAYSLMPFNSDLFRSSSMDQDVQNQMASLGFRYIDKSNGKGTQKAYNPFLLLGFGNTPSIEDLNTLKTEFDKTPETLDPDKIDKFYSFLDNTPIYDEGERNLLEFELNNLDIGKYNSIKKTGETLYRIDRLGNHDIQVDILKFIDGDIDIYDLINKYFTSPDVATSDLFKELEAMVRSTNDEAEVYKIIYISLVIDKGSFNLWDGLYFSNSASFEGILHRGDINTITTTYSDLRSLKISTIDRLIAEYAKGETHIDKLRMAHTSHLKSIAEGRVVNPTILERKGRDQEGLIKGASSILMDVNNLKKWTNRNSLGFKDNTLWIMLSDIVEKNEDLVQRIDQIPIPHEGNLSILLNEELKEDKLDGTGETSKGYRQFNRLIQLYTKIGQILLTRFSAISDSASTVEEISEMKFIQEILTKLSVIGFRKNEDGTYSINNRILAMYLNGVNTDIFSTVIGKNSYYPIDQSPLSQKGIYISGKVKVDRMKKDPNAYTV